jgi:hypothetical protein
VKEERVAPYVVLHLILLIVSRPNNLLVLSVALARFSFFELLDEALENTRYHVIVLDKILVLPQNQVVLLEYIEEVENLVTRITIVLVHNPSFILLAVGGEAKAVGNLLGNRLGVLHSVCGMVYRYI